MTLLVALDDSDPSWAALEYALEEHRDDVVVAHVVDVRESGYGEFAHLGTTTLREQREAQAEALFDAAHELAAEFGREVETTLLIGRPASEVVECAADRDVDRIIVGSHGRSGVSRVVLGSVAEQIARRSPVPVTIVR